MAKKTDVISLELLKMNEARAAADDGKKKDLEKRKMKQHK